MGWMQGVAEILQRYAGHPGGAATQSADPHQDFQQVARAAPPDIVRDGLSHMFRSDKTPSFPEMVANLFQGSDPNERAGLLNHLLSAITPGSGAPSGLGNLSGLLGTNASPETARQVSPEQVQQLATHAEQQDPSVIDRVSTFCSQHPQVLQAVGGLAVSVALQHMRNRR